MKLYKIKIIGKREVKLIQIFRLHWISTNTVVYVSDHEIDIEPFLAAMGDNAVLLNECDYTQLQRVYIPTEPSKFYWNMYTLRKSSSSIIVRPLLFEDAEKLVKFFDQENFTPRYGFYNWNPEDSFGNNFKKCKKYWDLREI